jgi:hypothetical protein
VLEVEIVDSTVAYCRNHSGPPNTVVCQGGGRGGSIRVAISAREVHAHKIHAHRVPTHKVGLPIRCPPKRCAPRRCAPKGCTPRRCTLLKYILVTSTLIGYTLMGYTFYGIYANAMDAPEILARKIDTYGMHDPWHTSVRYTLVSTCMWDA